jgi:hypothetical protein
MEERIQIELPINTKIADVKGIWAERVLEKCQGDTRRAAELMDVPLPKFYKILHRNDERPKKRD